MDIDETGWKLLKARRFTSRGLASLMFVCTVRNSSSKKAEAAWMQYMRMVVEGRCPDGVPLVPSHTQHEISERHCSENRRSFSAVCGRSVSPQRTPVLTPEEQI